jgi:hypothetical protein
MNDNLNRTGRPAAQSAARVVNDQQPVSGTTGVASPRQNKKLGGGLSKKITMMVVMVIIAVLVIFGIYSMFLKGKTGAQIQGNKFQAVFLNSADGQVYFGKLSVLNNEYYKLTDIYYVKVEQVQPDKNNSQGKQNISLAKLGNEIHGPQDVMYINKDNIMFWENLKDDGQVAKAISDYKKTGSTQTPAATTPAKQ